MQFSHISRSTHFKMYRSTANFEIVFTPKYSKAINVKCDQSLIAINFTGRIILHIVILSDVLLYTFPIKFQLISLAFLSQLVAPFFQPQNIPGSIKHTHALYLSLRQFQLRALPVVPIVYRSELWQMLDTEIILSHLVSLAEYEMLKPYNNAGMQGRKMRNESSCKRFFSEYYCFDAALSYQ